MMKRQDVTLTANAEEIGQLLHETWDPIFQMYSGRAEPDRESFTHRFGRYICQCHMEMQNLTGKHLRLRLGRMREGQACGIDGWRVAELKRLPLPMLNRLAILMGEIERKGVWPESLQRALVSFIPKGEGSSPAELRPISVMSVVYRLWAATRLEDAMKWQEARMSAAQHGARAGHGTGDVFWALALRIEHAVLEGLPLYGFNLDYAKCFDKVPRTNMLKLAEELGCTQVCFDHCAPCTMVCAADFVAQVPWAESMLQQTAFCRAALFR